jgi:hypothetical protein
MNMGWGKEATTKEAGSSDAAVALRDRQTRDMISEGGFTQLATKSLQKRKHAVLFEPDFESEFEPEGNIAVLPTLEDHEGAIGFELLREAAQKFQDCVDFALDIDLLGAPSRAGHTRTFSGGSHNTSSPARKQMRCMCCKELGHNKRTCTARPPTPSSS